MNDAGQGMMRLFTSHTIGLAEWQEASEIASKMRSSGERQLSYMAFIYSAVGARPLRTDGSPPSGCMKRKLKTGTPYRWDGGVNICFVLLYIHRLLDVV